MKRLFALILAAVMMLALAACGTSAQAKSASEGDSENNEQRKCADRTVHSC